MQILQIQRLKQSMTKFKIILSSSHFGSQNLHETSSLVSLPVQFTCKIGFRCSQRAPKRDIVSSYPSVIQIQREAFSGFSMRNRGILEKEPGQSRSDREQRLQKQIRYAAEEPHSR